MDKFTRLTGVAAPMPMQNIDTDKVIPARFLKTIQRSGLGKHLFDPLRFDSEGKERPDFILNQDGYRNAQIIIAHENFGCGSSREHAPWALQDFGIRCIIAPSFGDIFAQNSIKNGLLPAVASAADAAELAAMLERHPDLDVTVDLEAQSVTCGNCAFKFSIPASWRDQLLNGWDEIDLTRSYKRQIDGFREARQHSEPWIFSRGD